MTHRNTIDDIKTGVPPNSGSSLAETCLRARRCPVYRRRDSGPGFRMELENLAGDAKGKGTSGGTREAESTNAPVRGGLPHISGEAE